MVTRRIEKGRGKGYICGSIDYRKKAEEKRRNFDIALPLQHGWNWTIGG